LLPSASHASVLLTSGTFTPAGTYTCNGWGCDATKTCYRDLYGVYCNYDSLIVPGAEDHPVATTTLYLFSNVSFSDWCDGFLLTQGSSTFGGGTVWTSPTTTMACSYEEANYYGPYGVIEFDNISIASSGSVFLSGQTGDASRTIKVGRTNATDTITGDYYAWGCLADSLADAFSCGQQLTDVPIENLNQFQADATTTIPDGATTTQATVTFGATLQSFGTSTLQLQIEIEPSSTAFTGTSTIHSAFVSPGSYVTVSSSILTSGAYHWEARVADANGNYSDWQPFNTTGANVDFTVVPGPEPVIIVPGIMGTTLINSSTNEEVWPDASYMYNAPGLLYGDSYLDALGLNPDGSQATPMQVGNVILSEAAYGQSSTFYGNLVNNFLAKGYSTSTNLITFPYDWRMSVESQVSALAARIVEAASSSPDGKVNIIAHSLGGLLVKDYLSTTSSTALIDKLIFDGVPQFGAPIAFKILNYGDNLNFLPIQIPGIGSIQTLNTKEIEKISQNMPSIYELLPSQQYIEDTGSYVQDFQNSSSNPSPSLNYDETIGFIYGNDPTSNSTLMLNATTFHGVLDAYNISVPNFYNIVGCTVPTIIGFNEYGGNEYDLSWGLGDGTVPTVSTNLPSGGNNYFALGVSHQDLVSDSGTIAVMQDIIDNTTSTNPLPGDVSTSSTSCTALPFYVFSTHSPISLNVYDSAGDHTGPNASGSIDLNIPGSQYETIGENSFVIVPASDTYHIFGQASSSGAFTLKIKEYDGSVNLTNEATYVNVPLASASTTATVTGISSSTLDPNLSLDVYGNGTDIQTIAPTALLNTSSAEDIYPPIITVSTSSIPSSVTAGATTTITFSFADASSSVATSSATLNGAPFTSGQMLTFSTPGTSTIQFFAEDDAGNPAMQTYFVTVMAAPPSTPTSVVATATGTSTISLAWASSTDMGGPGLAGYRIFRCTGSCTPSTTIATSSGASYIDTGLAASTTYTYAVSAYDTMGLASATSTPVSTTTQAVAPVSVSLIQSTSSPDGAFGGPLAETFHSSVTAGDTLVVLSHFYVPKTSSTSIASLTDTLGNHFTVVTSTQAADKGTPNYPDDKLGEVIAYATSSPAGSDTVTLTFTGGGDGGGYMSLLELSPSTLDLTANATGTSATPSAGTATTTHTGEFAVANVTQDDGLGEQYGGANEVINPGTGWTIFGLAGGGSGDAASEYRTQSSTGSITGNFHSYWYGNLTSTWMAGMATFKP
ncbi:MAG TPA: hypothetical protein VMA75_03145, partial [Candidatus Paceibacterota bacterium]|nr:hypothetical protein [Candidatus Paceibacterota bacterium]